MNGKISLLDQNEYDDCSIKSIQVGRCKYIVVCTAKGGVVLHHASDCEFCHHENRPIKPYNTNRHRNLVAAPSSGRSDDSGIGSEIKEAAGSIVGNMFR